MDPSRRIEQALNAAVASTEVAGAPPLLAAAIRHAVFPGGARVRPRLVLASAFACGEDAPALTDAAAVALELMHCASLVHDDLPCFDDAAQRRGRPSVHHAFGASTAVLAGDALIVLAFQWLGRAAAVRPERLAPLLAVVARAVGTPHGIVAGQAWESEPEVDLSAYHRAKTGALFVAASEAGALAAGAEPGPWRMLGDRLGEAYQVADDIRDAAALADEMGKPAGRDAALGRPSAAAAFGLAGALERFDSLVVQAIEAIPACPGSGALELLIRMEAARLIPEEIVRRAA